MEQLERKAAGCSSWRLEVIEAELRNHKDRQDAAEDGTAEPGDQAEAEAEDRSGLDPGCSASAGQPEDDTCIFGGAYEKGGEAVESGEDAQRDDEQTRQVFVAGRPATRDAGARGSIVGVATDLVKRAFAVSQSLVSSIAGALMVEERQLAATSDDLPTALWDLSQHAREAGGTHFHYLASDTSGSDLVVSQLARRTLPSLYREFSGHPAGPGRG